MIAFEALDPLLQLGRAYQETHTAHLAANLGKQAMSHQLRVTSGEPSKFNDAATLCTDEADHDGGRIVRIRGVDGLPERVRSVAGTLVSGAMRAVVVHPHDTFPSASTS